MKKRANARLQRQQQKKARHTARRQEKKQQGQGSFYNLGMPAEGAGQYLIESTGLRRDASGNLLHEDVGLFLRKRLASRST